MHIHILEGLPYIDTELLNYIDTKQHMLYTHDQYVDCNIIDAIMAHGNVQVDNKLLNKYPNLQYIFRVGVGLNNYDLDACQDKNIKVINRPGTNSHAVADMAIRGILSLLRKGCHAHQYIQGGTIPPRTLFTGNEISSQHIGILGFGNIGQLIAKRLGGFDPQHISFYDPFIKENKYGAEKKETIEEILEQADIIILALPLLPSTKHIINKQSLSLCKSHLKLINIGRGGLIDETDLYQFLDTNPHASTYIDVREGEPQYTNNLKQLVRLDNFLITPHIGAQSQEAQQRMHYFELLT